VRLIELTQGFYAEVSDEDYESVSRFRWHVKKHRRTAYAVRGNKSGSARCKTYMHREIIQAPDGLMVDHVDGNGLNNQRSNLRLSDNSQNQLNKKHALGVANAIGITIRNGRFRVRVQIRGVRYYGGSFKDKNEAIAAYEALKKSKL
jgi:hypothetical protein